MSTTHNLQDALYNLKATNQHIVLPPANNGTMDVRGNDGAVVQGATNNNQTWYLPKEANSPINLIVYVSNTGTGSITVKNTAGTTVAVVAANEIIGFQLSASRTWNLVGTGSADVEAALMSIARIDVPLTAISKEDGTQMIKQATTVTGFNQLSNKNLVIQIPANSTAEAFAASATAPADFDATTDELALNVAVSKGGDLDALTLDAEFYVLGSSWSSDVSGASATAITQAISVLQFPCIEDLVAQLDGQPRTLAFVLILGGTNDGDVVYIHDVYWTYRKKLVSS